MPIGESVWIESIRLLPSASRTQTLQFPGIEMNRYILVIRVNAGIVLSRNELHYQQKFANPPQEHCLCEGGTQIQNP